MSPEFLYSDVDMRSLFGMGLAFVVYLPLLLKTLLEQGFLLRLADQWGVEVASIYISKRDPSCPSEGFIEIFGENWFWIPQMNKHYFWRDQNPLFFYNFRARRSTSGRSSLANFKKGSIGEVAGFIRELWDQDSIQSIEIQDRDRADNSQRDAVVYTKVETRIPFIKTSSRYRVAQLLPQRARAYKLHSRGRDDESDELILRRQFEKENPFRSRREKRKSRS